MWMAIGLFPAGPIARPQGKSRGVVGFRTLAEGPIMVIFMAKTAPSRLYRSPPWPKHFDPLDND